MISIDILSLFSFYREALPNFRSELESAAQPARLDAGALFYLANQGRPPFALVGSGTIRVFKVGPTGREITLYRVQAGETCLINMLCALLDFPPAASAQAETAVEALLVPVERFRRWIDQSDLIRRYVFETMSARLIDLMLLIEEVTFGRMDARLADYLCGRLLSDRSEVKSLTATHETIAAELGTAREVVSRLLKNFQRIGAIDLARGRIELRDAGRLRRLADAQAAEGGAAFV